MDLRLEFSKAEGIQFNTVRENINPEGRVTGNEYPNRYIIWLESRLLKLENGK